MEHSFYNSRSRWHLPIFTYHKKFNPEEVTEIRKGCEAGQHGCVECKAKGSEKIIEFLIPIHEKRAYFESNVKEVKDILLAGEEIARELHLIFSMLITVSRLER